MTTQLILLRHGESIWNAQNRFTGWTDVDLSEHGVGEAHHAAEELAAQSYDFDVAYTSVLKRAIRTLWIVLDELDLMWLPVVRHWRLNERHYGALQGLNKAATADRFGADQVHLWRRGFAVRPPALAVQDPRHPRADRRYAHVGVEQLPAGESLEDTLNRVMPYWHDTIAPHLRQGATALLVAHGNSLRALVKYLDHLTDEEVVDLNIPTGIPLVYQMDDRLTVLDRHYLGDPTVVEAAARAVAQQATADASRTGTGQA